MATFATLEDAAPADATQMPTAYRNAGQLKIWSLILSVCPLTQRQGCCIPSAASLLAGGASFHFGFPTVLPLCSSFLLLSVCSQLILCIFCPVRVECILLLVIRWFWSQSSPCRLPDPLDLVLVELSRGSPCGFCCLYSVCRTSRHQNSVPPALPVGPVVFCP